MSSIERFTRTVTFSEARKVSKQHTFGRQSNVVVVRTLILI